jgi:hypothetical protein
MKKATRKTTTKRKTSKPAAKRGHKITSHASEPLRLVDTAKKPRKRRSKRRAAR